MRLIQEVADQALFWRQPGAFKQAYELRADEEVVATLDWGKSWGTLATARTAEGAWTFKRSGFWQQRVGVRPLDSEREIASFAPKWSGDGTLTLAGGRSFHWAGKGFWRLEKVWQDREDAPPLIGFKRDGGLKTEARLVLSPVAAALPETSQLDDLYIPLPPGAQGPPAQPLAELPLLATLGFYLLVLETMDSAAAGATAATT